VIEQGAANPGYYGLAFTALAGVVISLYYYFGVIRVIYWSKETSSREPIPLSTPMQFAIGVCVVGMFWLGLMPGVVLKFAATAVGVLKW
jgi:NADH:ubiquinone oxidoreductase subunit 2 (subunit N)